MLNFYDKSGLERLLGEDAQKIKIVTRALIKGGEKNMAAARDVLETVREKPPAKTYWWIGFRSDDPAAVERAYELFSYPFESFETLIRNYCEGTCGAGGAARFIYLGEKLKAEGHSTRTSNACPSFEDFGWGGYDEKAEGLWKLFNVLARSEASVFGTNAAVAFKEMGQADISLAVLNALEPDQKERIETPAASYEGVRLGSLVATRSWKGDKAGRLYAKGHKHEEAAQKDFTKRLQAAETKLRG